MDWDLLAYCSRYGNQPLSELRALSEDDLQAYADALARLVARENGETPPRSVVVEVQTPQEPS